jgi:cell wall assembly regulator SMI1
MPARRRAGAPQSPSPDFPPRIPVHFYARDVAFNADGSRLYVVGEGVVVGFARGGRPPVTFEKLAGAHSVRALAVSPTAPVVACAVDNGIAVYDADGKLQRTVPTTKGTDGAACIAFSPDGALFVVGTGHLNSKRTTLEIFSAAGERVRVIDDDQGFGIAGVCFTADGAHVVTVRGGNFERWSVEGGAPERRFVSRLQSQDLMGGAGGLIVAGWRGISAVDERGKVLWQQPNDREIESVAVSPDAAWVVAGKGRTLTVTTSKGEIAKTITRKSTKEVRALAISADGWLAVGTDGGVEMVRLSDAPAAPAPAPRSAPADAPVAESWRRIDAWLKAAGHDAPKGGASQKAIADLADKLAFPLPAELVESLAIHDGGSGLIGGWDLLNTKEIASEAKLMKGLTDDGSFGEAEADPHPRIKSVWWNVRWIPIVSSGSGHLFCVDMDPAPGGKAGQVILFFHDDGKRLRVADSVRAWLAAIAADLEAGTYEYDAESGSWSDSALLQSSLEGKDTYG